MAVKTCPSCQLVHRASATRCECGYDFEDERQTKPKDHRSAALPWHEEPLLAVAALFFCWPAGLVLLSQNKHLSGGTKTLIVFIWMGLLAGFLAYRLSVAHG